MNPAQNQLDQAREMQDRTQKFALRVIHHYRALPKHGEGRVIGNQLLRSATGMAANYRAVCRSRSKAEFVAKMGVTLEEADESLFWLELIEQAEILPKRRIASLAQEATELVSIFSASRNTARGK